MAILRFIPRLSSVSIHNLSVLPLVATLAACGVSVEDTTPSPATYFVGNYQITEGYQIKAKVHTELLTTNPSLASRVNAFGVNQPVAMSEMPGGGQDTQFSGLWPLAGWQSPTTDACGFEVHHSASARFLGVFPIDNQATRQISGNLARQGVFLWDYLSLGAGAFVKLNAAGTINTGMIYVNRSLTIQNRYPAAITVQSVKVLCGVTDCAAATTPPVQNIQIPQLPVTLACGSAAYLRFQCTDKAIQEGGGGTFVIGIGSANLNVPFRCAPEMGA